MTELQVTITVNETKVSPARVVEEMVKGFVTLREFYFGLSEPDLAFNIETLTVKSPKRQRHSRRVLDLDETEAVNQEYIKANSEPQEA